MEFKSINMRARSSSVSSRCARSATYETSFSVTMMCFLTRSLFAPAPHHKLDGVHRLRTDLLQGRKILPLEASQLLLPRRVGNLDREYSIRVANRRCLLGHFRSARQRPGQQRRVLARLPAQGVGEDLLQCCAGMSHVG